MTRLDRKSDSQANAEAVNRRDSAYLSEHYASMGMTDYRGRPTSRPRGLIALLGWFESCWWDDVPQALHGTAVWHDEAGGSAIGAPTWTDAMRRLLEAPTSERDGYYVHPLAAAMASLERRNPFMASFLRAIALSGFQVSTVGIRLRYEEDMVIVYAEVALERLWGAYRSTPPARPLPAPSGVLASSEPKPAVVTGISTTPDLVASPSP